MNILSRIQQLSDIKRVTMYTISQETGISQSVFSRLKTETTAKLSRKNLDILANYFCVNADWLATGSGDMYASGVVKDTKLHDDALWERIEELAISLFTPDNEKTTPFINYEAMEMATSISAPRLYSIIRENEFPTYTELLNIADSESLNISSDWLLTGKGSMLKSESSSQGSQQSSSDYTLIAELKKEISALKDENNQLKGENKILRELAGLGERKESGNKSA